MEESVGKRISRVAQHKQLTREKLQSRTGIIQGRLDAILDNGMPLEDDEKVRFAKALDVDETVLTSSLAEELWIFLREKRFELRFERLWPIVKSLPALRGPDTLKSESLESNRSFYEQLLLDDRQTQLWEDGDDIPWWTQ